MIDESQIGQRKSDEEREASLPEHLRNRTEEQKAQDRENQKLWAQSVASPFIQGSPATVALARAVRLEEDWRNSISSLRVSMAIEADPPKIEELNRAYWNAAKQLAEALATQGRFAEAAYQVRNVGKDLEVEYSRLQRAVDKPDEKRCGDKCDLEFAADKARLTQDDVIMEVFSPAHGQVVPVFRCNMCGSLNARPFTEADRPLLKRREMRKRALELSKGQTPSAAAETLERAGLTTEKAFA